MEKLLRTVLLTCLLLLVVLTPLWWRQEHPAQAAATEPPASMAPIEAAALAAELEESMTPIPTADPLVQAAAQYREAESEAEAGRLEEALAFWEALGDYEDSAARAESCREALYERAWELLLRRELDGAAALLRPLDGYRDSLRWLHYCERHLADTAQGEDLLANSWTYYRPEHGKGVFYACSTGLYYLPNETGPETKTLLYFPGGSDYGLRRLNTGAVIEYVNSYAPDALCFFAWESGFHVIEEHNHACWRSVEDLLRACSRVPHEIVLVGTSNGFYAAERMALQLWDEEELPVRAVVSLDAGEDWGETDKLLDDEELARLAQAGTRLELFEQKKFNPGRPVIQALLRAGLAADLIECDNGDHETITVYAFRYGVPSWALGECGLNEKQYRLTELVLIDPA